MNIAVLGAGAEFESAVESLVNAGHQVTHVGPSRAGLDQYENLADKVGAHIVAGHEELLEIGASNILMVSYPALIKREELERANFYNIHCALLPRFRGFHGLVWSIINDEKEVGYTLHVVDEGIDSGDIIHQASIPLLEEDDNSTVRQKINMEILLSLGSAMLDLEVGRVVPRPQDQKEAIIVSRRRPEDGEIDWNWPSRRIFNLIRALTPPLLPGAFTWFRGEKLVITKSRYLGGPAYFAGTGKVMERCGNGVLIKCGDGLLEIDEVVFHGETMSAANLLTVIGTKLG